MLDSPLLANVLPRAELTGTARRKAKLFDALTVKPTEFPDHEAKGWAVVRRNKHSLAITRAKSHDVALEDRVWSLMWTMGFPFLSGPGGALVTVNPGEARRVTTQIDVLVVDEDMCLSIECKSAEGRSRRQNFQQELAKHSTSREPLQRAINPPGSKTKRPIVLLMWTMNAILSMNDRERAKQQGVVLLNEQDLAYFEALVYNLGPASRYQFLSEVMPGRPIPGLKITVPALQAKLGGHTCYTFAIPPEYLLKVAYVARRTTRKSDVGTYQRMLTRSRLKRIAEYIRSGPDAMFPTNVVLNLQRNKRQDVQFSRAHQEVGSEAATFGWLTITPAYKSAWIIDGQHRLYAYSFAGPEAAERGRLSVLAFVDLPSRTQQKLFTEINAEQKSVKRSLLQELYPDLHRDADDPREKVKAVISTAVQFLNDDADSPFFDRIQLASAEKSDLRCITLTSVFTALQKPGFFWSDVKGDQIFGAGPFWDVTDERMVKRCVTLLNAWFTAIRDRVPEWWDAGQGPGGGLAMNDGVSIAIDVFRSIVEHLKERHVPFQNLSLQEAVSVTDRWARDLADYFAELSDDERREFRGLRGNQGHTAGVRHAQAYLRTRTTEYDPAGLTEFLEREQARTNDTAISVINEMERQICRITIGGLKAKWGGGDAWWFQGVPKGVRGDASRIQNDDENSRGERENYLNFIHYRAIIEDNWPLFADLLAPGKQTHSKAVRTEWMEKVNRIRQITAHGSTGTWVSFEELDFLRDKLDWLKDIPAPQPD
jgi:DNA sulfur modification protein DndB